MSEAFCAHCANQNPKVARVCTNCGMPILDAAPTQDKVTLPRVFPNDTQTRAPSPPVGQPISSLPPTTDVRQNRARQGWPKRLTLREFAKTTRPDWLPSWFTLPAAVVAGVVLTLALFFVQDSVRAGVFDSLAFTKAPQGESKEVQTALGEAQTAPKDTPTTIPSSSPLTPLSDILTSFLPPFSLSSPSVSEPLSPTASDAQSPQTASSASPAVSSTGGEGEACQQEPDADDFAQALDFSDGESLAEYLGLEGGKDKLAQVLKDCNDLEDLASSLGFTNPESLAGYLGLDDERELERSLRASSELSRLSESLGLNTTDELAERLGVDKRKLVRGLRDSENSEELSESLGFDDTEELAERLGVGKGELSTLLDSATTDGGKGGTTTTPTGAKFTTDEAKSASDNGKSGANGDMSTTNDDIESAANDGGSTAKEPAGANEAPASTVSSATPTALPKASTPSPASATQDPPPATEEASSPPSNDPPSELPAPTASPSPPPKTSAPSPAPAAQDPPAATEEASSPTSNDPPDESPSSPSTSETLTSEPKEPAPSDS